MSVRRQVVIEINEQNKRESRDHECSVNRALKQENGERTVDNGSIAISKELLELSSFIKGKRNYSRRMSSNYAGQNKGRCSWKVNTGIRKFP